MTDNREAHNPLSYTKKDYGYQLEQGGGWLFEMHDRRKPSDKINDPEFLAHQDAIMEKIVKCVNSHDLLVRALKCQRALDMHSMDGMPILKENGYVQDTHRWASATEFVDQIVKEALKAVGAL